MAYRFTNTDKWGDAWFAELSANEKLLFLYLCDNCDIAGFIEYLPKRWSVDIGISIEEVEAALKGLKKGIFSSKNKDCFYIKNFLKHQKNLPLNEKRTVYVPIIKKIETYYQKFEFESVELFINTVLIGYEYPIDTDNNNGDDNDNTEKGGEGGKNKTVIKKTAYAELVLLTINEYDNLIEKYGYEATHRMIEILDNYKGAVGKKYKSDYKAILNWVVKRYDEEVNKNGLNGKKPQNATVQAIERNQRILKQLEDEYRDN